MANLYWPGVSQWLGVGPRQRRFLRLLDQAEQAAREVLLVSHGGCLDGAGATIVTLRALGADRVGVATCQPSDMQQVLEHYAKVPAKGRTLMIADLSLNQQQFEAIAGACRRLKEQGWRIEWRDHHHKQWEGVPLDRLLAHLDALEVNDDATESGASLQQQAVAPKDRFAKRLAETIRDRDLWWNKTPDSETLEYAMTAMGEEAFIRHFLGQGPKDPVVDEAIAKAAAAERQRIEAQARELLGKTRYWTTKDGERVGVVYGWLPKNVGLHRVLEKDAVQVAINVRPNGHVSLRSRKGADVCQEVARVFGGGGHPNASGATLGLRGPGYLWYVLRRGRVRRVQEFARVGVERLEARRRGA